MQYTITIFPNIKQPKNMHRYGVSFSGLADFLTKERPATEKIKQVSWSSYTFKDKRSNKTAETSNLAIFDFDENTLAFADVENILKRLNLQHILHTTFSHTGTKHKYRLILPLNFTCAAADQKHLFKTMNHWSQEVLKMTPDKACKDAARTFFTSYKTTKDILWTSVQLEGDVIDWHSGVQAQKEVHAQVTKRREEAHKKIVKATHEELESLKQTALDAMFSKKHVHLTRSDEKRYFYALASCDKELRLELARRLNCDITYEENEKGEPVATKAAGFQCPFCKRHDTFYYIDPTQSTSAYCAHVKTCSEVYAPKKKGEFRSMKLGYIADMRGLI